jgi:hypothetical protein
VQRPPSRTLPGAGGGPRDGSGGIVRAAGLLGLATIALAGLAGAMRWQRRRDGR